MEYVSESHSPIENINLDVCAWPHVCGITELCVRASLMTGGVKLKRAIGRKRGKGRE